MSACPNQRKIGKLTIKSRRKVKSRPKNVVNSRVKMRVNKSLIKVCNHSQWNNKEGYN